MRPIRAGELRHRITIQSPRVVADPNNGAPVTTWPDVATVAAAVEPLRGREYFESRSQNSEVETRIRIRYLPGVAPKMRAKFGTRMFDIQAVINLEERNRELHLMCKEYTDGR